MQTNKIPSWDEYYLNMAVLVSKRSKDIHTKHGAVIVDKHNRVISTGYNGPPAKYHDELVPQTRPDKYDYFIHAEINALLYAWQDLTGCTIYITGYPCMQCLMSILQSGIVKIVCLDKLSNSMNQDYPDKVKKAIANFYQICELVIYPQTIIWR